MGVFYENLLTDALNDQNFNYMDDMDDVELFIIDYFTQRGATKVDITITAITGSPKRLKIDYDTPTGSSSTLLTINTFN